MGILRAELPFEGRFTQTPNEWTRDETLSRRARGLLTEILSHRVGWRLTVEGLVKSGPEGRHAIRAAIDELRDAGYLVVEQGRGNRGQFGEVEYRLSDPAVRKSDTGRSTASGSSDVGSSDSGGSTAKEDHSSEDHPSEDQGTDLSLIAAVSFEDFWAAWPKKVAKPDAQRAWTKATKTVDGERIIAGAIAYRDNPGIPDKQFIPYPATWLNRAGWDDELPTPAGRAAAPVERLRDTYDMAQRLQAAADQRELTA